MVVMNTHPSPPGLTRGSIFLRQKVLRRKWIAGSSPAMTAGRFTTNGNSRNNNRRIYASLSALGIAAGVLVSAPVRAQAPEEPPGLSIELIDPKVLRVCADLVERRAAHREPGRQIPDGGILPPGVANVVDRRTGPDGRHRNLRHLELYARPVGKARIGRARHA
jgi:hypothetical protein